MELPHKLCALAASTLCEEVSHGRLTVSHDSGTTASKA